VVTVGSLLELHKTSPLILGNLHHVGVLDFVGTSPILRSPIDKVSFNHMGGSSLSH
jgi:hypothetical protein